MFRLRATAPLFALLLATAAPAMAAGDGFAAAWTSFKTALAKDDKTALSHMIGHNQEPFAGFYTTYLKKNRRCLLAGKPVRHLDATYGVTYYVKCDSFDYVFMRENGVWLLDDQELDD